MRDAAKDISTRARTFLIGKAMRIFGNYFDMLHLFRFVVVTITLFCLAFFTEFAVSSNRQPALLLDKSEELVISPRVVMAQKDQNWLFVDVRRQKEFERFRVRGSLNIPIHELKNKTFLKTRNVVLVNARNHHLLLEAVIQLHQTGFTNMKVLQGGLRGWQHQSGSLDGDFFSSRFLDELSPREFQLFKEFGNWQLFILTKNPESHHIFSKRIGQVYRIDGVDQVRARVEQLPGNTGEKDNYTLIVTETGQGYEEIRHLLEGIEDRELYYLQGGVEGCLEYIQTQAALIKAQQEEQSRCGTCP